MTRSHERIVHRLAACSPKDWRQLVKEVSWAYRDRRTHVPLFGFLLGRKSGLLPSGLYWMRLRKEVITMRRKLKRQDKTYNALLTRERNRVYMREYMREYRRARAREWPKVPPP